MRRITELARTAYHEAGHAAVAFVYPRVFKVVALNVRHGDGDADIEAARCTRNLRDVICMNWLAGQESERFFFSTVNEFDCLDDRNEVEELLRQFPPRGSRRPFDIGFLRYFEGLEKQTQDFVIEYRRNIEHLASALIRHRRVSGRLAKQIWSEL